jgi:amino-acid N-acetyltransferase
MTDGIAFRFATIDDEPALRALLVEAALPSADVAVGRQEYLLAVQSGRVVGSVGLEVAGDAGLLRSFAVAPALRNAGLGSALYERALAHAALRGVRTAYVLTTTAERFCLARGFERVDRGQVPPAVAALPEFRTLCPATAVCLRRRLEGEVRFFPRDVLRLRPDVPGASMWAVALERAMLTWYELAPDTTFPRHAHPSEQITLVLEGELWFTLDGRPELRVGAGEVIAIPSDVPHAVATRGQPARAVDAWSPVRPGLLDHE